MNLPNEVHNRKGFLQLVQELDSFDKIDEKAKEEKTAIRSFFSYIVATVICLLLLTQIYERAYGLKHYLYTINAAYYTEELPTLVIDMQVATSCGNFELELPEKKSVLEAFAGQENEFEKETLKKDPTRFDLSQDESAHWKVLQSAHRTIFADNNAFEELHEIQYVNSKLQDDLRQAADDKARDEAENLAESHKNGDDKEKDAGPLRGRGIVMIGNGMGMFQIISVGAEDSEDEGTACRIHGQVDIKKMQSEKITIIIGGGANEAQRLMAHMAGSIKPGNSSHRIESFHFGKHSPGMITPLAGVEEISASGTTVYTYNIKVIPTRLYHRSLFGGSTLIYQYAVTSIKKDTEVGSHAHGAIILDYELSGTVIEVTEDKL
uniref:COPIIcoated_ERV domain-containing protein n=1 Tax=Rhabditophanes sp. KR3021 TaxID=114890 RepID=A0AC35U7V0_9BILA